MVIVMEKVLFLIHDLGPGGAEKVLVNLVNNMDPKQFDITVMALFDVGVNRQFLKPHIRYRACFKHMIRGNSHLMKLLSPRGLHKWLIKDRYDIEISFLEGPSARIISGCPSRDTKILTWVHCMPRKKGNVTLGFRSYREAENCYSRFDRIVCVAGTVEDGFRTVFPAMGNAAVCYNTNDSSAVAQMATEPLDRERVPEEFRMIGVGRLIPVKAFDRLLRIHAKLHREGYPVYTDILGEGVSRQDLETLSRELGIADSVAFWGYQTNPYKYVANSNLFVCSSLSEGFSTAATESLIVGTPVVTTLVSGMKEMLGENNEWGIVTDNDEEALYEGIKRVLDDPKLLAHYKEKAAERGKTFSTENTVKAVEEMLLSL